MKLHPAFTTRRFALRITHRALCVAAAVAMAEMSEGEPIMRLHEVTSDIQHATFTGAANRTCFGHYAKKTIPT